MTKETNECKIYTCRGIMIEHKYTETMWHSDEENILKDVTKGSEEVFITQIIVNWKKETNLRGNIICGYKTI